MVYKKGNYSDNKRFLLAVQLYVAGRVTGKLSYKMFKPS